MTKLTAAVPTPSAKWEKHPAVNSCSNGVGYVCPLALRENVDMDATGGRIIYCHRELRPLDTEVMGEHIVEVTSRRVPSTVAHRDELWR